MNKKVLSLGMRYTTFFNFTGLDLSTTKAGAYGTARDANLMAIYAMDNYPYVFRATVLPNVIFQSESGQVHKVINTNTIIYKIPNLLFSKTGFTTLAGGNLSVIFRVQSGDIIAITLLGSTKDGRFTDMEKLVETAYTLDYGNVN
jgi:D-alanyl-D-alanine carboxypeptidase